MLAGVSWAGGGARTSLFGAPPELGAGCGRVTQASGCWRQPRGGVGGPTRNTIPRAGCVCGWAVLAWHGGGASLSFALFLAAWCAVVACAGRLGANRGFGSLGDETGARTPSVLCVPGGC